MLFYENKKYKKSLESLFKSKNFENVDIIPDIQKLLNKGENVYCTFDPYVSEISGWMECIYDTNYDTLMQRFFLYQDEI